MAIKARGSFTVADLTDGKSITLRLSTSKGTMQVVSGDSSYTPDWSDSNNVVTPQILVSGEDSAIALQTAPTWKVGGVTITSATSGYTLGDSSNGYALTITSNLSSPMINISCEASYTDSNGVTTAVEAEMPFTRVDSASDGYAVLLDNPNLLLDDNTESTALKVILYKGGVEQVANAYKWYELEAGAWSAISGATSDTLTVTRAMVESKSSFKAEVTPTSGFSGTKPSIIAIVDDITDEYSVEVLGNAKIKPSTPTTTLIAKLLKNGVEVTDTSSFTFTWSKMDKDGVVDTDWSKTGATIEIDRDDVDGVNTFTVEVEDNID